MIFVETGEVYQWGKGPDCVIRPMPVLVNELRGVHVVDVCTQRLIYSTSPEAYQIAMPKAQPLPPLRLR